MYMHMSAPPKIVYDLAPATHRIHDRQGAGQRDRPIRPRNEFSRFPRRAYIVKYFQGVDESAVIGTA